MTDPYETLGISKNASLAEVEAAFREKLSKEEPLQAAYNQIRAERVARSWWPINSREWAVLFCLAAILFAGSALNIVAGVVITVLAWTSGLMVVVEHAADGLLSKWLSGRGHQAYARAFRLSIMLTATIWAAMFAGLVAGTIARGRQESGLGKLLHQGIEENKRKQAMKEAIEESKQK